MKKSPSLLLSVVGGAALVMSACGMPTSEPIERERGDIVIGDQDSVEDPNQWSEEDWNDEWEEDDWGPGPGGASGAALSILNPLLETTLGTITISGDHDLRVNSYHESYGEGGFTEVTTTAANADNGAGMVALYISGGLNHADLRPGARLSFSMDDNGGGPGAYGEDGDLNIDAIGCTGPEDGFWTDFDAPADEVDIEIEEGEEPGTQVLNYRATFFDYDGNKRLAEGSFTYNPSDL